MQVRLRVDCQQGACLLCFSLLEVQRLLFRLNIKVRKNGEEEDRLKEILSIFKMFCSQFCHIFFLYVFL